MQVNNNAQICSYCGNRCQFQLELLVIHWPITVLGFGIINQSINKTCKVQYEDYWLVKVFYFLLINIACGVNILKIFKIEIIQIIICDIEINNRKPF